MRHLAALIAAIGLAALGPSRPPVRRTAGRGHHHVLPDGRQPGDGSTPSPAPTAARAAGRGVRREALRAILGMAAGGDAEALREALAASPRASRFMGHPATRPLLAGC